MCPSRLNKATEANILPTAYANGAFDVIGPPVLDLVFLNQAIKLSWAVPTAPFVVQTSEARADWIDLPERPTTNGSTVSVTVPLSGTNQFFRLRKNQPAARSQKIGMELQGPGEIGGAGSGVGVGVLRGVEIRH
jgi:hypothetical protein